MHFAKWTFRLSGIYGVLVTIPIFFTETRTGEMFPPPITHPEFYYGFASLCLAWQIMFLLISTNPIRYRHAMLVGVLEKMSFAIPVPILFAMGRVPTITFGFAMVDTLMLILFAVAYVKTPRRR